MSKKLIDFDEIIDTERKAVMTAETAWAMREIEDCEKMIIAKIKDNPMGSYWFALVSKLSGKTVKETYDVMKRYADQTTMVLKYEPSPSGIVQEKLIFSISKPLNLTVYDKTPKVV